nr:ROK family protein [Acinetobacter seifertii]
MTNGKPLLGARGWVGELGYLPVKRNEGIKRLDALASGPAIIKLCTLSPSNLELMANNGDQPTLAVIRDAGQALDLGIATVINLLNPSQLLIRRGTIELPSYL